MEAGRFAQLLRHARLRAGLTQEALAERARLSWRTISDLERHRAPGVGAQGRRAASPADRGPNAVLRRGAHLSRAPGAITCPSGQCPVLTLL